ncbi:crotonase/enoyl-CoA hydratase family protein [Yinghuangia aomiensis]|uniref:Crotonase/enoyl-CoA hydratase family protein n=1 Tax=Yinghuangia aomiensis TaxID=676205 RepID=A0ABP9HTY5_9ACTN
MRASNNENDLRFTVDGHIATLCLNRPERRNAFTLDMLAPWVGHLHRAEADPDIRVVVLTGAGDSFCSGVDLDVYTPGSSGDPWGDKRTLTTVHQVAFAMEAMTKPVIAAIRGPAYGAGMDMALMCDLRIAAESARFCQAYINVGAVPGDGGCWYLPRLVGMQHALRLMWTGEVLDADAALGIGLVSEVCPDDDLLDTAYRLARRIAERPPVAVQLIKRAAYEGARHDLRTALDLISSHLAVVAATRDSAEARAALRERRTGVYEGR